VSGGILEGSSNEHNEQTKGEDGASVGSERSRASWTSTGNTPLVSIIIPCYNHARYLGDAIKGASEQTHSRVQIVVVDDGSFDNTFEVASRYPDVFVVRQQNRGVSQARNVGFQYSSGEYVLFLDADDRLTPTAVETHLRCFAEHPEAGFVVGDIDLISEDGSYLRSPRWPDLATDQYEQLLKVDHVANTIAVMFRRSVFEAVGGFDLSRSGGEDYELLLRTARAFAGAQHRCTVAQYRRHRSNTTRRGTFMLPRMEEIMQAQISLVAANPVLKAARRQGEIQWRDFYGAVTIKEVFRHFTRGNLLLAIRALAVLRRYVRGRVFVIPWKYRKQALRRVRDLLHSSTLTRRPTDELRHLAADRVPQPREGAVAPAQVHGVSKVFLTRPLSDAKAPEISPEHHATVGQDEQVSKADQRPLDLG
jgi:glycosyltransferase involved in cell wall biosynthesis